MSQIEANLGYVLPIAAVLYGLLQLAKDWNAHKTTWRRAAVFILIMLVGVGGVINNYAELQKAQKAQAPAPKAELSYSFAPFPNAPPGQPITLITDKVLPLNADGSAHVEFNIVNTTDVDAVDVEVDFQICNGCRYAKEPEGLQNLAGLSENQRYLYMKDLLARTSYKTLSVDVIPPPSVQTFLVGVEYRCHTCVIENQPSSGTVHILR